MGVEKECNSNNNTINSNAITDSHPSWTSIIKNTTSSDSALLDSGANVSLVKPTTNVDVSNIQQPQKSIIVPNGSAMTTTTTAKFKWKNVTQNGKTCHKVQGLVHNLAAVSNLVDEGNEVLFRKHDAIVRRESDKRIVLRGWRDDSNRLWRVPINDEIMETPPTCLSFNTFQVHSVYDCQGEKEITRFYHATLFSPVKSTLIKAVKKGYLRGWPGLKAQAIQVHIRNEEATVKGHMNQTRQGIRSTKNNNQQREDDSMETSLQEPENERTNVVFCAVEELEGRISTDQTGFFPRTSARGMKYVMIFYVYDANYIKGVPIKNRTHNEFLRVYREVYEELTKKGFKPKLHKLDNEKSAEVLAFIQSQNAKYQLTPPEMHRTNPAEKAVQTWKNHFIAGLASLPPAFPIALWCHLVEQANITLNLLRPCRQNPALSAQAAMNGCFVFDATPMAPPGTKALAHVKPKTRVSWGYHAENAWYVGPAMEHYRCYKVVSAMTKRGKISDTVTFQHHTVSVPTVTPADRIIRATKELNAALRNQPSELPTDQISAINKLREVLLGPAKDIPQKRDNDERGHVSPEPVQEPSKTPCSPNTSKQPPVHRIPFDKDDIKNSEDSGSPSQQSTIPFEDTNHGYNLRSRAANIINSVIIEETRNVKTTTAHPVHHAGYGHAAQHLLLEEAKKQHTYSSEGESVNAILDETTGKTLEYRQLRKMKKYKNVWEKSFTKELDQLAQGKCGHEGTNTIFFIRRKQIPPNRKITYGRIVVDYRPQKEYPNRTRLTVGGDRVDYPYEVATPTADITTSKLLFNSVLSTTNAKFFCADISNFYLNTPLDIYEYMRLPLDIIPEEVRRKYNLDSMVESDGYVYIEIRKGMYGLPQAGILANKLLTKRLKPFGYQPCQHTPGLWRHEWRPIRFSLVVDDFGIKYVGKEHADHLIGALQQYYKISIDWSGALFCGIHLQWDYNKRSVTLSMPGYIEKALKKFEHPQPKRAQHAPHKAAPIQYGRQQQPVTIDTSPPLTTAQVKYVQKVVGTLLYYSRAVDPTLAAALSSIATAQTRGTEATLKAVHQLLDYVATYPNATIKYLASDMILTVHSDASYLSESESRSRAAGHFFLSNKNDPTMQNGPILTLSTIIRHVMASASEAELAALFYNAREAVPLRITLEELGHPQPSTTITTDNATAVGLTTGIMTPKRSKMMDMRFHWLKCREAQNQFKYSWTPASENRADYPSKHHPGAHHQRIRAQGNHVAQHAQTTEINTTNPTKPTSTLQHHMNKVGRALIQILTN